MTNEGEFLADLECTRWSITKREIDRLVKLFYALPGNGCGGSLHIVLDDDNVERSSVEFCLKWARDQGDATGEAFARLLLELTDEQLEAWLGKDYE